MVRKRFWLFFLTYTVLPRVFAYETRPCYVLMDGRGLYTRRAFVVETVYTCVARIERNVILWQLETVTKNVFVDGTKRIFVLYCMLDVNDEFEIVSFDKRTRRDDWFRASARVILARQLIKSRDCFTRTRFRGDSTTGGPREDNNPCPCVRF